MLSELIPQQETAKLATESLVAAEVDPLGDQVKTWWSMESYASNCSASGRSKEEYKALELFKATTRFDGERYEVGLIWKNAKPHLPKNYSSAVRSASPCAEPEQSGQSGTSMQRCLKVQRRFTIR